MSSTRIYGTAKQFWGAGEEFSNEGPKVPHGTETIRKILKCQYAVPFILPVFMAHQQFSHIFWVKSLKEVSVLAALVSALILQHAIYYTTAST